MNSDDFLSSLRKCKPKEVAERLEPLLIRLFEFKKRSLCLTEDELDNWVETIIKQNMTLKLEDIKSFIVVDYEDDTEAMIVIDCESKNFSIYNVYQDDDTIYDMEVSLESFIEEKTREYEFSQFTVEDAYDIKLVGLYYSIINSLNEDYDDDEFKDVIVRIFKKLGYSDINYKRLDDSLRFYHLEEGEDMEDYAPEEGLDIDFDDL